MRHTLPPAREAAPEDPPQHPHRRADRLLALEAAEEQKGYGIFTARVSGYATPRPLFAHRVSYEVFKRGIPEGRVIAHSCARRACVNPAHLRATTPSENEKDKYRRKPNLPLHQLVPEYAF